MDFNAVNIKKLWIISDAINNWLKDFNFNKIDRIQNLGYQNQDGLQQQ
jgi:hypothetical protein